MMISTVRSHMDFLATPCAAQEIHEANQKKEYTLIATQIQRHLFTDDRLNPQAVKCCQLLFEKVRFTEDLSIKISYQDIGKLMSRSRRTAIRVVNALEEAGYLKVTHHTQTQKRFETNTYQIRVPQWAMRDVMHSKDRFKESELYHPAFSTLNDVAIVENVAGEGSDDFSELTPSDKHVTTHYLLESAFVLSFIF
ncbi:MAG TPA: hypothetical protein VIH61_07550 [Waddliaceae bacterium]